MGYAPDWMRGSMKKATTGNSMNYGVQARPIFHSAQSTVQAFADGGEADSMPVTMTKPAQPVALDSDPVAQSFPVRTDGVGTVASTPLTETSGSKLPTTQAKTDKFGDAFAAARKGGLKEFTWQGKSYNTQLKGETVKKSETKSDTQRYTKEEADMVEPLIPSPPPKAASAPESKASVYTGKHLGSLNSTVKKSGSSTGGGK